MVAERRTLAQARGLLDSLKVLTITLIAIALLRLDLLSAELFAGFCVAASKSFSSDISRFFTGSPTDKALWILVGGVVVIIVGLAGLLRGSKA